MNDDDRGPARAVSIDSGGVLILPDPDAVRCALRPYGAEPDDETCYRAHYETMRERDADPARPWSEVDETYARVAGVAAPHVADAVPSIAAFYAGERWTPAPGAVNFLAALRSRGIACIVVSNAFGTMENILARAGVCSTTGYHGERVTGILDSQVLGVEKPSVDIFRHAARVVGFQPDELLHIGDISCIDAEGATAAGMRAVHLDPLARCSGRPHLDVPRLDAVLGLLDAR